MARAFAITTAGDQVSLDQQRRGEITYTVSNTTTRPLRAWPRIKGLGSTDESWISVVSGGERSFSPGESHQFVVKVNVPADAPTGKYSFRLNLISGSKDVEDESIEGPAVSFEVKPAPVAAPKPKFPWWIAIVAAILLVGGLLIWIILPKRTDVVANFGLSQTRGLAPLTARFTNLTSGEFAASIWDFGDGGTSTNRDPEYTFKTPGTFTVTLMVPVSGAEGILVATQQVQVLQRLKADFVATPSSGPAPLSVKFLNQTEGDAEKWEWDFGNGQKSNARDPAAVAYTRANTYTVRLTATGEPLTAGETNADTKSFSIEVRPPTQANFTASPTTGVRPLKVQFNDRSQGNPGQWNWTFGDGTRSTAKNPTHTYTRAGTYTVSLRVTGPGGQSAVTRAQLVVVREDFRLVPNVTGQTLPNAQKKLAAAGLKPGKITRQTFGFGLMKNTVVKQQPGANTKLVAGSAVDLVVGQ
jgi:PKD repeat protein